MKYIVYWDLEEWGVSCYEWACEAGSRLEAEHKFKTTHPDGPIGTIMAVSEVSDVN